MKVPPTGLAAVAAVLLPAAAVAGPAGGGLPGAPPAEPITKVEQQALRQASPRFRAAEALSLAPIPGVATGISLVVAGAVSGKAPLVVAGAATWGTSATVIGVGLGVLGSELQAGYAPGGVIDPGPSFQGGAHGLPIGTAPGWTGRF
jgi:hypothetical protein